jgi:hypothetical protein
VAERRARRRRAQWRRVTGDIRDRWDDTLRGPGLGYLSDHPSLPKRIARFVAGRR